MAKFLDFDEYDGLTRQEAAEYLKTYGYNADCAADEPDRRFNIITVFARWQFFVFVCGVLSFVILGEYMYAAVAGAAALADCVLRIVLGCGNIKGGYAVRRRVESEFRVIRDGEVRLCLKSLIVPHDIIILSEGESVPADCEILECENLTADESLFTHDCIPVRKSVDKVKRGNMSENIAYKNTKIITGLLLGEVIATGRDTKAAKENGSYRAEDLTAFEKILDKWTPRISFLSAGLFILIAFGGVFAVTARINVGFSAAEYYGQSVLAACFAALCFTSRDFAQYVRRAYVKCAKQLAKVGRVKNFAVIERLTEMTVFCVDCESVLIGGGAEVREFETKCPDLFINVMVLSCGVMPVTDFEKASLLYAAFRKVDADGLRSNKLLREYRGRVSGNLWEFDGRRLLCIKGYPEDVLTLCDVTPEMLYEIQVSQRTYCVDGLRVMAYACFVVTEDELPESVYGLQFAYMGLAAFSTPIRENVSKALAELCVSTGRNRSGTRAARNTSALPKITDTQSMRNTSALPKIADTQSIRNTSALPKITDTQSMRNTSALPKITDTQSIRNTSALPKITDTQSMRNTSALPKITDTQNIRNTSALPKITDTQSMRNTSALPKITDTQSIRNTSALPKITDKQNMRNTSALPKITDTQSKPQSRNKSVFSEITADSSFRTIFLTTENETSAGVLASSIGMLPHKMLTGDDLRKANLSGNGIDTADLADVNVFARINPSFAEDDQKTEFIQLLRKSGEIVGIAGAAETRTLEAADLSVTSVETGGVKAGGTVFEISDLVLGGDYGGLPVIIRAAKRTRRGVIASAVFAYSVNLALALFALFGLLFFNFDTGVPFAAVCIVTAVFVPLGLSVCCDCGNLNTGGIGGGRSGNRNAVIFAVLRGVCLAVVAVVGCVILPGRAAGAVCVAVFAGGCASGGFFGAARTAVSSLSAVLAGAGRDKSKSKRVVKREKGGRLLAVTFLNAAAAAAFAATPLFGGNVALFAVWYLLGFLSQVWLDFVKFGK